MADQNDQDAAAIDRVRAYLAARERFADSARTLAVKVPLAGAPDNIAHQPDAAFAQRWPFGYQAVARPGCASFPLNAEDLHIVLAALDDARKLTAEMEREDEHFRGLLNDVTERETRLWVELGEAGDRIAEFEQQVATERRGWFRRGIKTRRHLDAECAQIDIAEIDTEHNRLAARLDRAEATIVLLVSEVTNLTKTRRREESDDV